MSPAIFAAVLLAQIPMPPEPMPNPSVAQSAAPEGERAEAIGQAAMLADGTIVLDLYRPAPARLIYRPSDAHYQDIRRHIGEIKPGEERVVTPWPDT